MTDGRPVLVGLDNPHSSAPEHALYPYPPGCSGHRLWQMIRLVDENFTDTDYCRYFDRVNLSPKYPAPKSKAELQSLWRNLEREYRGRSVVVMGRAIFALTGLEAEPACLTRAGYNLVAWVPHPSGRNRFYNDLSNRKMVGEFLRGLVRRG